MVHETAFSTPAASRKSLGATLFERNTMLKTLKRKIALVAVAGLGFGLVSTVPAFAAPSAVRLDGTPGLIIRTDAAADLAVTLESSAAIADQTDITVTLKRNDIALGAVPAGLTIAWSTNAADRPGTAGADAAATQNSLTVDADDAVGAANVALATITFARTMAVGKYTIGVTVAGADEVTFTTYVSTVPTAMAWDATSYALDATDTKNSTLSLTDAGARPSYLLPGEAIDLAIAGGATGATKPVSALSFLDANTAGNTATSVTIGLTTTAATAGSYTFTATRASGLTGLAAAASSITVGEAPVASSAIALKTTTYTNSDTANTVADPQTNVADTVFDGTAGAQSDSKNSTNDVYDLVYVSTSSPALTFVGDSDANDLTTGKLRFIVSAHAGGAGNPYPNGVTAVTAADVAVADASGANNKSTAEYTVTSVSPVQGSGYRIAVKDGANVQGLQVEYQNPVPNSIARTTPTSTPILTVKGGKSTATATVKDQFGVALANVFVGAAITGRNAQSKNLISDANGVVTMEWTDAYVESTTNTATADVLTFTIVGQTPAGAPTAVNTATLTVNYAASVEVGTVTATGLFEELAAGDANVVYEQAVATDGTSALTIAPNVGTGNNDFQDQVQVTALVKDATIAAAVMQGVPVVFTGSDGVYFAAQANAPNASKVAVAGSTAVKTLTVYTSALGQAVAQARFTKTGTGTITMTAGGKTATISVTVATDDGFAHSIAITDATSAADAPATLTATVKDPFGNVVSGADVSFVATGGVFLNGLNAVNGTTDSNGQVVLQVAAGDKTKASSVTVKATVTETSLVGTLATDALVTTTTLAITAGVSNKTGTITFTAPTAGGTSTAVDAVKADVKAVSDTVATLSKAVTTIQSSVTELTTSFTAQIKSLSAAIAKISKAIAALSKKIK
jgi:hypothetical protein